jgi:hypothetical protein
MLSEGGMQSRNQWADARRIEAWAGETRVNLIRLIAITAFYGHHLINVYLVPGHQNLRGLYHATVTTLVFGWLAAMAIIQLCLVRRWVPPALKYLSTTWDIVLITGLMAFTRDRPTSAMTVLFFLVIGSSALRLSLGLVYLATLGSIVAYLFLLGFYAFWVVGYETYYSDDHVRIPRTHEVIFVLALGTAGLLAGQAVRQARRLAEGYPATVASRQEK